MILQFLIFVSILSVGLCSTCSNLTNRLPKHAIPAEYQLWLQPNLTTGNIEGEVVIDVTIASPTNQIVLHASNLTMILYSITVNYEKVEAQFIPCDNLNYWTFNLNQNVKKGDNVVLHIDYRAIISNGDHGMYYTPHVDSNGTFIRSAITQMEPVGARLLLPCFDEPNLKAIFHVSITRDPSHLAISNMPIVESTKTDDGLIIDYFEPTPIMSTYLIAVGVLEGYESKKKYTNKTEHPIQVGVYAPKDIIKHSTFAVDTIVRSLEYFEDYTNVSYPLEKLDAIGATKFSGAMENWGLMIFNSYYFTNESSSRQAVSIICHEVAHQWFGNIVTMDWWDETYLNEGFTTYMQEKCMVELYPEWNTKDAFYKDRVLRTQKYDSTPYRPIIFDRMKDAFNYTSYSKPAAIIHMIAETVGQSNFQMAMREYLKNNLYSNTKSVDVWSVVEKYSKDYYTGPVSLQSFVHGWMNIAGFPYVRVSRKGDMVTVYNQTQYLASGEGKASNWTIPLFYRTDKSEERELEWMGPEAKNVSWNVAAADWMILNTGGVGYFKTLYDEDMYKKIGDQLMKDHTKISPVDRQMILSDAFEFVDINMLDPMTYLTLMLYSKNERDKNVQEMLNGHFEIIRSAISDQPESLKRFERLVSIITKDWYSKTPKKTPLQRKMGRFGGIEEESVKILNLKNMKGVEKWLLEWDKKQKI